jgi:hypothetical protein
MERDTVPAVMLQAYQAAAGDLAERLLAALDAAEGQGGDARGRQAAALMIEGGPLRMDCRIDDHPDPLKELRRLVGLRRAYFRSSHALELLQQGEVAQGMTELAGLRGEHPTNPEFAFWYGAVMAAAGSVEQGRAALLNCYAANPRWLLVLDRVAAAGLIPLEPSVLSQLRP